MTAAARGLRQAPFVCEKRSATGARGMAVTNHPLASGAATEILLGGGNAIDAAIAALFALTVVEPMMVGILGGGISHIRLADGRHIILDGTSTAPGAATPDMYEPLFDVLPNYQETRDRKNAVGAAAVAVPGALAGWCEALSRFGTMPLADVLAPAIRLAERGFTVTPYLSTCIGDCAADLARDADLAALLLPDGAPAKPGTRLHRPDYAASLRLVAGQGASALYSGPLGEALITDLIRRGGLMTHADLTGYRVETRDAIRAEYRGFSITGPPPPCSSGVHIAQMLNILEPYDLASFGFGAADTIHLMAEAMKIAFADRAVATADPAFMHVPVDRLTSKSYAAERRAGIAMDRAQDFTPGIAAGESADTTHLTVADAFGNVVASTQTINGLFGARIAIAGTGMIANNYMFNFDPHPGHVLSVAPGKHVFTSMAPMIAERDGRVVYALGLPGALRIFPSAMQALINLIDHGMTPQEAVEAPRIFTQGHTLEVESAIPDGVIAALSARGHPVVRSPRIAGGMSCIAFAEDGMMTGAACWRADGTPVGIGGGLARAGVRFVI